MNQKESSLCCEKCWEAHAAPDEEILCHCPCHSPSREEKVEEYCDVFEVWMPTTEKDSEVYDLKNNRHLKLAVMLVDGVPVRLADGVVMERRQFNAYQREEALRAAALQAQDNKQ
jgi:hypothetical protein